MGRRRGARRSAALRAWGTRRKTSLVYQHLERISSEMLERYQRLIRRYARRRHGIYALYKKGRLYYVGLARNLNSRLKAHLKDRHRGLWDHFSIYLTIEHGHMKELESLILRIAEPKGNSVGGRFTTSEDLRRRLKRDIVLEQRLELQELLSDLSTPVSGGEDIETLALVSKPVILRASYKGKRIRARLKKDGRVKISGGKVFASPSAAARAVVKRSVNGWSFWRYERGPGVWAPIKELRE